MIWKRYFNPLAPRGARRRRCRQPIAPSYFNPLAPRGARRPCPTTSAPGLRFQSTRPSRGETNVKATGNTGTFISIHSPLAGRDGTLVFDMLDDRHFNPLAPRGARHLLNKALVAASKISIHSPLAGRDQHRHAVQPRPDHFNPLAPRGARPGL